MRLTMAMCVIVLGTARASTPAVCNEDVVVILDKNSKPLQVAASALVAGVDYPAVSMTLDEFRSSCSFETGKAYIAVGPSTARHIIAHAPDDVRVGFCMVPSLKRAKIEPRPNVAGVVMTVRVKDQLELIKRVIPDAKRIGLLHRSDSNASREMLAQLESVLPREMTIVAVDLAESASVSDAIKQLTSDDVDVIWTFADSKVFDSASVRAVLMESIRSNTPVYGFSSPVVRAGALCGMEINPAEQGRQLARLLRSTDAANARIEHATPRPVLNLVVADRLDLDIPDEVRELAVEIYE